MDKELNSLITKYKTSCQELKEINSKIETVNSSEQVIANHLSASTSTSTSTNSSINTNKKEETDEKLNQIINKLKLDVDTVLIKRLAETKASKSVVQSYIDNTIWTLFSRTELQNNTLLFNNDQKRINDQKCLIKLISTLFEMDQEQTENDEYKTQLHDWMIHIITIYLRLGGINEKKKILVLLTTTSNIESWAIPLIQINVEKMSHANEFLDTLDTIFIQPKTWTWTEDDFLVALDQLAIDFNYSKIVESVDPEKDSFDIVLNFSQDLINKLMQAIHRSKDMNNLVKRIAQTMIQISILLIDSITEKGWECQDQVDTFMSQLIYGFYDLKDNGGWFFLPNIPFKALSIDALWLVTVRILQIKNATSPPTSISDVLDDHLPNITRFQYELHDNQMQGFFMLNCLANIATCIPSGVDEIVAFNGPKSTLSACIVTVISYTLFAVAFVDKDLREVFYKDVRDNFGPICKSHPFIISLLFRWTVEHIAIMERMALYLFHSLKLDNWNILKDDLKLLHKLMSSASKITSMTSQQIAQIQLAKYIIQHLNYDYKCCSIDPNVSKSQPWHSRNMPFLNYDVHEEVAFILLDACQQFQPLPDTNLNNTNENKGAIELVGTVTTAVSTYLPIADQIQLLKSTYDNTTNSSNSSSNGNTANDFINWAWSVAIKLRLYDCPISPRASDIENSITLPFLKLVLNSYNNVSSSHSALLIYISFMLSVTSRHFLRFESNDGWMKLLVILKRGKPEAVIHIFSEMIPSFVYMHGDDFFNDESLSDFFKHMIELKTDPMLIKAAAKMHNKTTNTGIGLIIGSHVWHAHLIDSVSDLMDENGKGFSYVDLVMHSWLKTVFRKSDWMWHSSYVNIVDSLCEFAFILYRHGMVYHMLLEEHKRMETTKLQQSANSPRLTRFIKNMVVSDGGPYASLLIGEWSVLKANKGPGIEQNFHWFAFEVLILETINETAFREELCSQITKLLANDPEQQKSIIDLATVYKLTSQKKPMDYLVIYRWLQHIIMMPVDHPLLPLYLQMFFSLYYLNINDEVTLGFVCFNKKTEWTTKLRDYIASVQTYHGQKITTTTTTTTTTTNNTTNTTIVTKNDDNDNQQDQDKDDNSNSGHTVLNAEVLQQFYYAMWLWLGNADLIGLLDNIHQLPSHYNIYRLKLCYAKKLESDQPWNHFENYWMDLVETEQLEQNFLNFPWEGSEKFRTDGSDAVDAPSSLTTTDDLISLSTTTRRLRLITDESTIEPLPPLIINEPSTSISTSSITKKMHLK